MALRVKGLQKAIETQQRKLEKVRTKKLVAGIYKAMYYVGAASAPEVPVDTATLLNSQFREIIYSGYTMTGRLGYSAGYALFVHNAKGTLQGKHVQRPHGRSYYWDPNGNPKFLSGPLEDAREEIVKILRDSMKP